MNQEVGTGTEMSLLRRHVSVALKLRAHLDSEGQGTVDVLEFDEGGLLEERSSAVIEDTAAGSVMLRYELGDESRSRLREIQERYSGDISQSRIIPEREDVGVKDDPKEFLFAEVTNVIRWQSLVEMTETLLDSGVRTKGEVKAQDRFWDAVRDRYSNSLWALETKVRTDRAGIEFVRELLDSKVETLVALGLRLIPETSLRASLQDELLSVYGDTTLNDELRDRAFGYLRSRHRRLALGSEFDTSSGSPEV